MASPAPTSPTRALARLGAWRWQLAALVVTAYALTTDTDTVDMSRFAPLGQDLLTGHLGRVYAGNWNQAGPTQLIIARLLAIGTDGARPALMTMLAIDLAVIAAVRSLVLRVRPSATAANLAAAMTVLWLGPQGVWTGHPAEALIGALWIAAGVAARRQRTVLAGLAIGAAATIAPWAVLGAPVLLVGRALPAARSAMVAAALGAAAYLPFVVTGSFAMFKHAWTVVPDSLVHLLDPSAVRFGWAERLVQAAFVLGACTLTAIGLRDRREVVVLAPLVAAAARIVTDPVYFDYYWVPLGVLAVTAIAICARSLPLTLLAALAYLPWAASTVRMISPALPVVAAAVYLAILACCAVLLRRRVVSPSASPAAMPVSATVTP